MCLILVEYKDFIDRSVLCLKMSRWSNFSISNKKQVKFFFDLEKCFTFAELISTNKKIIRKWLT
jgi:hypothetical protein